MEKGINAYLKEQFQIESVDIRSYSPLVLAYIGDGIYELVIRSILVDKANTPTNKLHKRSSLLVKAEAQAKLIEIIREELTEEEFGIYKRGRNAKSPTMAKNATVNDYRKATGFEALMGYLYLTDQFERLVELIKMGLQKECKEMI